MQYLLENLTLESSQKALSDICANSLEVISSQNLPLKTQSQINIFFTQISLYIGDLNSVPFFDFLQALLQKANDADYYKSILILVVHYLNRR